MIFRAFLSIGCVLVSVAACSGGGDVAVPSTGLSVAVAPPTISGAQTVSPPASAVPATVSVATVPPTTASLTMAPSTTVLSTVVPDPGDLFIRPDYRFDPVENVVGQIDTPDEQAIVETVYESWRTWEMLNYNPSDESNAEDLLSVRTGPAYDRSVQSLLDQPIRNARTIPNPDFPARVLIDADTISIDGATATVELCELDSGTGVVMNPESPNGYDVTNPYIYERNVVATVFKIDDVWFLYGREFLSEVELESPDQINAACPK